MMNVMTPNSYDVELPNEDYKTLDFANALISNILSNMNNYGCDILACGYEECNYEITKEDLQTTKNVLRILIEENVREMY